MSEEHLPDRRKHGYRELEEKLEAHVEELREEHQKAIRQIEARFAKRYRGMLIAFSIIGLTSALALAGFGILLDRQGEQQDQLKIQQTQLASVVEANTQLALDIQQQRKDSIRATCQAQNDRHDATTASLIKEAGEDIANAPTAEAKEEIRRRRDVTLGLIDLVQPVENCDERVSDAVKPVEEP